MGRSARSLRVSVFLTEGMNEMDERKEGGVVMGLVCFSLLENGLFEECIGSFQSPFLRHLVLGLSCLSSGNWMEGLMMCRERDR